MPPQSNGGQLESANEQTKAEQFLELAEELLEPEEDHLMGWCKECESTVWIDTNLQMGPAESCTEHEPLCHFQEGGCCD